MGIRRELWEIRENWEVGGAWFRNISFSCQYTVLLILRNEKYEIHRISLVKFVVCSRRSSLSSEYS